MFQSDTQYSTVSTYVYLMTFRPLGRTISVDKVQHAEVPV